MRKLAWKTLIRDRWRKYKTTLDSLSLYLSAYLLTFTLHSSFLQYQLTQECLCHPLSLSPRGGSPFIFHISHQPFFLSRNQIKSSLCFLRVNLSWIWEESGGTFGWCRQAQTCRMEMKKRGIWNARIQGEEGEWILEFSYFGANFNFSARNSENGNFLETAFVHISRQKLFWLHNVYFWVPEKGAARRKEHIMLQEDCMAACRGRRRITLFLSNSSFFFYSTYSFSLIFLFIAICDVFMLYITLIHITWKDK